jgi:hypothetical protein
LGAFRIETRRRKKSPDSAYICSVFVWVNWYTLPIEHLQQNEFEEFLKDGNHRKMISEIERQAEPLCKFGPGGDFVAVWEPKPSRQPDALARLLGSAVDMLAAVFGIKRAGADMHLNNNIRHNEPTARHMEKPNDEIENGTARNSTDTAPTPAPANGGPFSGEPLLFPDLGRNGIRIEHKPKHRIRASRRTAKKGAAFRIPKQGSLFEGQFTRARIA